MRGVRELFRATDTIERVASANAFFGASDASSRAN